MFRLKALIFIISCLPQYCKAISAGDTIFYDEQWNKIKSREGASYYGFREKTDNIIIGTDYYLTGGIQMKGAYRSLDPDIRQGHFIYYDSVGIPLNEGEYINNKREGRWTEYIPHTRKVGIVTNFQNDSLHGARFIYDLSGNIQFQDSFLHGQRNGQQRENFKGTENPMYIAEYIDGKRTGVTRFYDSLSGKIYKVVPKKDGKSNGKAITYYRGTDRIWRESNYINDLLEGLSLSYDSLSGKVIAERYYKKDERHGLFKFYTPYTGKLRYQEYYEKDKRSGHSITYDTLTGYKIREGEMVNDSAEGYWTYYYGGSERIREVNFVARDTANGPSTMYHMSGNKEAEGKLKRRYKDGLWTFYCDKKDVRIATRTFTDGVLDGQAKYFDSASGKLTAEGMYKNGDKEGIWEYYYRGTGIPKSKEEYKNGLNNGIYLTFYEDGSRHIVGAYQNDERTGKWQYYYKTGQTWMTVQYHDGYKVGDLISYHYNGVIKRKEKYLEGTLTEVKCFDEFGEAVPYTPIYVDPKFEGEISTFIGNTLRYPKAAKQEGLEGKVVVEFSVNENGRVSDITIKESLSEECDEEAIRIVSMMDRWTPATFDEQPVKEKISIPIVFWLREDTK
jgi:TonB family protein